MAKRPDMFEKLSVTDKRDRALLEEIRKDAFRKKLTEPLSFRPGTPADMGDILRIVGDARASLKKHKVDQWQGPYPDEKAFLFDMDRGECFVLLHGQEIAGFFTLSTREEKCYGEITDGKWTADLPYCVLHRAAVAAGYRGSGMAEYMMKCVEEQARRFGRRSVRVDTHKKNKAMQRLLRDNGYRYRGNVQVIVEPGRDSARQAFEKLLKKEKGDIL